MMRHVQPTQLQLAGGIADEHNEIVSVPEEHIDEPQVRESLEIAAPSDGTLEEYDMHVDAESGLQFYVNVVTGESVWEPSARGDRERVIKRVDT